MATIHEHTINVRRLTIPVPTSRLAASHEVVKKKELINFFKVPRLKVQGRRDQLTLFSRISHWSNTFKDFLILNTGKTQLI